MKKTLDKVKIEEALHLLGELLNHRLDDLMHLNPTEEEILTAARWSMSQDPSPAYSQTLKSMLKAIGHGTTAEKI